MGRQISGQSNSSGTSGSSHYLWVEGGGRWRSENRSHSNFAPPPRNHALHFRPLESCALEFRPLKLSQDICIYLLVLWFRFWSINHDFCALKFCPPSICLHCNFAPPSQSSLHWNFPFPQPILARLPRSMPNADQCRSKSWHFGFDPKCLSMPITTEPHHLVSSLL